MPLRYATTLPHRRTDSSAAEDGYEIATSAFDDTTFNATFTADDANTVTDEIKATIVDTDVDVDSDNDNGFSAPDRSAHEEWLEQKPDEPEKIIAVNDGDADGDGIPDYADGYDLTGVDEDDDLGGVNFVPVTIQMPAAAASNARISISYSDSNPLSVNPDTLQLPSGRLRLWTVDADDFRDGRNVKDGRSFVASGVYDWSTFEGADEFTLWVESLSPSAIMGDLGISVRVDIDGDGPIQPANGDATALSQPSRCSARVR